MENKIKEYNDRDVELLKQICDKIGEVLGKLPLNYCTISSYAYKKLKNQVERSQCLNPSILNGDDYKFVRSGLTGGRVQTIEKFKKFEGVDLTMIDVVSLYRKFFLLKHQ